MGNVGPALGTAVDVTVLAPASAVANVFSSPAVWIFFIQGNIDSINSRTCVWILRFWIVPLKR